MSPQPDTGQLVCVVRLAGAGCTPPAEASSESVFHSSLQWKLRTETAGSLFWSLPPLVCEVVSSQLMVGLTVSSDSPDISHHCQAMLCLMVCVVMGGCSRCVEVVAVLRVWWSYSASQCELFSAGLLVGAGTPGQ